MEILNSDGSQASACGNGTRCVADYIMQGRADTASIATAAGILRAVDAGDFALHVDFKYPFYSVFI